MCSNFENTTDVKLVKKRFNLDGSVPIPNKDNLRPTDQALIIKPAGGGAVNKPAGSGDSGMIAGMEALLMTWGIPAPWDNKPLINARAETLLEKATFSPLLDNRCLIVASAYYEWRKEGRSKLKNRIAPADPTAHPFMTFAGLHNGSEATIITCAPTGTIAHIHHRMPVILNEADGHKWLNPTLNYQDLKTLLAPASAPALTFEEDVPENYQPDLFG